MRAVAAVGLGLFVTGVVVAMAGCHHRHEVIVEREAAPPPREVVVEEAPPPETVVVQEAPPPVVVERYGPPPEVGMVWVGGYYTYYGHHYVWSRGHWGRPPHPGYRWESHRWVHERGGYRYHPGGWHR